ncbi:hypothetical protein [Acinetobacter pollinis]|uniref:Uncharacterized protein n=1 Tax=Acinetobacter pollinis TaxID=2605270 RepID=A0ABU6DTW6_9GAMM|nr:hypothetical protein [Acinetobacter pollinis]MEB5477283.1 hypothetical protein [Acinetobacter pollinis]
MKQATHIENDGTYWRCENGLWYWWRDNFGWCGYIGKVDDSFLGNKTALGQMYA